VTPRELCELMVEFGLVRLKAGDVELERSPMQVLANAVGGGEEKTVPEEVPEEDQFDALLRMTPEQQDRALTLAPTARR
jgi:hypothetical protein